MKRYTVEVAQFYTVYAHDTHSARKQFRLLLDKELLKPDGTATQFTEDGLQLDLDGTEVETLRGLLAETLDGVEDIHPLRALLETLGEDA